jgi:hypothetical protein
LGDKKIWIEHGQQHDEFNAFLDYGNPYALPVGYFRGATKRTPSQGTLLAASASLIILISFWAALGKAHQFYRWFRKRFYLNNRTSMDATSMRHLVRTGEGIGDGRHLNLEYLSCRSGPVT